ncbi:MAG: alpha/beta fold hydrolase, partial [Candidatus Saccharimonadales bacterium]
VSLTTGALNDIINAPSTASFEAINGEMFVTGVIDSMMNSKPAPYVLLDYQASSSGRRLIEAMEYVRSYPVDLRILQKALFDIQTPVLSIWGAQDPLVPPSNAKVLDTALPRTRSLMLESGHFAWEDRAEEYAAAILEWIRGGYRVV